MKLRRQEECEQKRTATEKMKYIFTWNIYVTIGLCFNILWLKAINEITARQTRTSLICKHDIIKVCSIEYLTTQIELVLPTLQSWAVHKIIQYLTLAFEISVTVQQLTFFDPPCIAFS